MTTLARGENRPAPGDRMTVTVACHAPVDVSALLLGTDGRVRSDGDFIFFNQPAGPGVTYRHGQGRGDMVDVHTGMLPPDVDTVVVTASLDGRGPANFGGAGPLTATIQSPTGALTFPVGGLSTETAVVCVEIYRRGDAWKVRAVGQGYDNGLAGIATAFGVNIDDEPDAPPTPNPPAAHHRPSPPPPPPRPVQPSATSYAPPAAHPAPTPAPDRGAQPMQSDLFSPSFAEATGLGIQKQGSKMIKVGLDGEVMARSGSMVAYQGELRFQALGSGGIGRAIQQRLTGEGVPLMKASGRGDLFLANAAAEVHIIDLDGSDGLTINGANVLAFDPTLSYNIKRVQGAAGYASNAGFFNCVFTGRGRIAITTEGTPVVLQVDQPTYADPQAAVAWSSSLQTGIKRNDSFGLGRLIGRSTGEGMTLSFSGRGFVIVQPSELPPGGLLGGTGGGQDAGQSGGALGGLFS
ncbi:AIM24 family protein [Nocardia otitidiscaviarum]|uniref:AIM24 family protein n=1 Tax=Nocardia otitidiscaviarum TaxID=1823 RepID=UPI0004A6EE77|nr:AIM24 family protein [Nocardia otitidiscaviarum]MBF6136882.1 AIM24 family protein [Nocardia otitidiscaviarum]MBF6485085.1 AIM24 family protein [Nocardia otitidiscaviarum]